MGHRPRLRLTPTGQENDHDRCDCDRGSAEDERLPVGTTIGYGVQHILAMFGGVIAVPLIIGGAAGLDTASKALLVSCGLFVSGAATVLQTLGVKWFGAQLPLVQGTSFAAVSTMTAIIAGRGEDGLRGVYGAVIVAAAIGIVLAPFFSKIIRFFPPVVTGSIITVIGLSLMPVAAGWITGQPTVMVDGAPEPNPDFADATSIGLAAFTLLAVLVMAKIRFLSRLSILLGLVVGTVFAALLGQVSTDALGGSDPVALPQPFAFGAPVFEVGAIVSMTIVILVIMVETTADILAVGEVVGTKVDSRRVSDGLRADMGSSLLARSSTPSPRRPSRRTSASSRCPASRAGSPWRPAVGSSSCSGCRRSSPRWSG